MRIFEWFSDALRQYGPGRIVVAAATVEEARAIVEADVEAQFQYCEVSDFERGQIAAGDQEEINDVNERRAAWVAKVREDIAAEPQEIVGSGRTVFISGSE